MENNEAFYAVQQMLEEKKQKKLSNVLEKMQLSQKIHYLCGKL